LGTQPNQQSRIIFGPFTYDGSSGELRKHGTRLRIAGQPLQILEVLLERPGQVFTREELQQRLWKSTTFGDFEHGLNAAVNKLRQTLGDSAEQPRYVETLPGRGYRFISALERAAPKAVLEMVQPTQGELGAASEQGSAPAHPLPDIPRKRPAMPRAAAVLGLALLVVAVAAVMWRSARSHPGDPPLQTVRYRVPIPAGMRLSVTQSFSLSPDGRTLVYLASGNAPTLRLWAQSLDSLEPIALPGTESRDDPPVFWSPDARLSSFMQTEASRDPI
jgi:DNA-binding winged helix-turn-helix (wHTH) protein